MLLPSAEMDWKQYASAFLLFCLVGTLLLYAILRVQPLLHPFDPTFQPAALAPDLAMNTAISFATTALIVGGLSYLPALAMGPIVEQLLLGR